MAYNNKKSAKRKHRKHRKYSRRSKKGGVITLVINPKNSRTSRKSPTVKKEVDEAHTIKDVADVYTRLALEDALSTFSRQAQEPVITQTTTTTNRHPQNKRAGPTASQIEKAEQKALKAEQKALEAQQKAQQKALEAQQKAQQKALEAQQKAEQKALAKQLKEEQKEEANKHKVYTKAANDVTTSAINQAFFTLFNEPITKTGAK